MKLARIILVAAIMGLSMLCLVWNAGNSSVAVASRQPLTKLLKTKPQQVNVVRYKPYSIISMQAELSFAEKGTFSENIINNPKYETLQNIQVGEGVDSSADDLLVIISVLGSPGDIRYA